MGLERVFASAAMAACTFAWSAPATALTCDIIPENVEQSSSYSGFAESRMCEAGLPALWKGLPDNTASVMRFTFTSGHSMFFRTVTITEFKSGKARIETVGGGFKRRDVRTPWNDISPIRRRLSTEKLTQIRALVEEAGVFKFKVGTWDKSDEDEGRIFMHCQLLEMERMDASGYRFSSVNIGCNRPNRLMPLVDEIIARGRIAMVRDNWAGYR